MANFKRGSFPAFEALFRKYGSALPAAIRRPQGGYYHKGSITEHAFRTAYKQFCKQRQLGTGNDSSQELGSRKSGGPSSGSFRGMELHNSRHFCVGLSAGAPNTIQSQASAGLSNGEMRGSSTEGSTTGDESSDSDAVEGREYQGSAKQQGFLYVPVPDTKEEWQEQIYYEPQAFESVHKMHQIQDDKP